MTLVVKSDNEINSTKAKISHSKKQSSKSKLAAASTTKNLVNIQPKPSPPFLLPCQPPFIYPSSNSAAVAAQQQLFSLQLLMSSPYFAQALAAINANNSNANTTGNATNTTTTTTNKTASTTITTNTKESVNTTSKTNSTSAPSTSTTPVSMPAVTPTTTNTISNSKLATSVPPSNTLPFLPPNISLPYLAAVISSLANANQQMVNPNNKTGNNGTTKLSTSAPSTNTKNINPSTKGTKINPAPSVNSSLFPKSDNAAANAALLLNNSLLTNQFLQFLQQQQQQQQSNKPLMVNPFAVPNTTSNTIPIAANSKTSPVNISSSFPSGKGKSKLSSSYHLKSKNSKLSTSPNMKSKIKLPIKKDPMAISKNHRRTSISQSYDPKNPMVNSLFNMVNSSNNKLSGNANISIKTENESVVKDYDKSPESVQSSSPTTTMATSPLLISIPFSNLNIRSNSGSSPTMESNVLSAPNLSTLCKVASQEAKLFIPSSTSSEEKKDNFTTLPSTIKEEECENDADKETNIFSKLDTSNRNAPTSLLTKNIQSRKMMEDEKKINETEQNGNMDEDKKPQEVTNSSMSLPMPMQPMSLPTITINSVGENAMDKKPLQHSFNPSTSTLFSTSPQSPSALSSTSSSSSSTSPKLYNNGIHSVPHTALQRRKSRSMSSKDYVCELCKPNKRFVQLAHLRIHQRKHTGERPFVCSFCNKSFAQQGNLKTHQRKHTGERPFTCPICFKTFTQSGNLKQHELVHQGVRPFVCEWCDKTFTQSGNLKTHQIKMHPELMQHAEDGSIIRSPVNSTGGRTRRHSRTSITTTPTPVPEEDHMMIDNTTSIPENEEENNSMMMMMIDEDESSTRLNLQQQQQSSDNYEDQVFGMDSDDYDEIQPMESGVIRPNINNNGPGYNDDQEYYPNDQYGQEEDEEEGNFDDDEDDEKFRYNSAFEFEGDMNDGYNLQENNIKERQLLKRLKALLKRN